MRQQAVVGNCRSKSQTVSNVESWSFEAKKRFGLCVLDSIVTSNHIHLLLKDTGPNVIGHSMQLIAGRTRGSWFKSSRFNGSRLEFEEELRRFEDSRNVEMSVGR